MTPAQWKTRTGGLAADGETAELRLAGRAVLQLESMDAERLAEARRWAARSPSTGRPRRTAPRPGPLRDGPHVVEVMATRHGFLGSTTTRRLAFVVDTRAPQLAFSRPPTHTRAQPLLLAGSAGDAVRVTLRGRSVKLDHGRF